MLYEIFLGQGYLNFLHRVTAFENSTLVAFQTFNLISVYNLAITGLLCVHVLMELSEKCFSDEKKSLECVLKKGRTKQFRIDGEEGGTLYII